VSKTLHYIDSPWTGPYFVFFIGTWVYLRHYLNWKILISEFHEFKTIGPYILDWEAEQYKCELSHWISTILLGSLQVLNLYWGFLILRVAWRFGVKGELADERSEDEDEEMENEDEREILMMNMKARPEETGLVTPARRGGMPKRRAR
jgi:acyl-CoA-dependent ceramide synthase